VRQLDTRGNDADCARRPRRPRPCPGTHTGESVQNEGEGPRSEAGQEREEQRECSEDPLKANKSQGEEETENLQHERRNEQAAR